MFPEIDTFRWGTPQKAQWGRGRGFGAFSREGSPGHLLQSTEVWDIIDRNQPAQQGHLAKYVVEVGDEDDNEGEAAKDVEEAGHISCTR